MNSTVGNSFIAANVENYFNGCPGDDLMTEIPSPCFISGVKL